MMRRLDCESPRGGDGCNPLSSLNSLARENGMTFLNYVLTTGLAAGILISSPVPVAAATVAPSWTHPPHQQREGQFWRTHWYDRDAFAPRLGFTRRARINAANAVLDPRWGVRTETRENGLLLIESEEDLFQVEAAELYAELWGGHPGTANKRVTINGRHTYTLNRTGTEAAHCTYTYPSIPLEITDLVKGFNAVQWNVEPGTTFWGHAMVDQAALRFALTNSHPDLVERKLDTLNAQVRARVRAREERIDLRLTGDSLPLDQIASVTYQAHYRGYDENGNLHHEDWHGFTQDRRPLGFLATSEEAPFNASWDTRMIPAQKNVAIRALVSFKSLPDTVYLTAATTGLSIPDRRDVAVHLYRPIDLPESFWSRANNAKTCTFVIDEPAAAIEQATLFVKTWTGGPGEVKDYFTLNGTHFPVAEGHEHEIQFNQIPVDPSILRQGRNTIRLLSDTEHHGIEIIYPGPALMVRVRL